MTIHHTNPSAAKDQDQFTATLKKGESWRKFNDTIRVSSINAGRVDISFQRTVRVPDNQGQSGLPPSMGTFPLYPIANYHDTLPEYMAAKGGIFFPMYRKSPLATVTPNSADRTPFAIKVFLGGVNAVSGEPTKEDSATMMRRLTKIAKDESIQDYIVTPAQLWLDGIASKSGFVRQFVAMPLGSGYSVEAQVTGQETTGGMQFLVVPTKHQPTLLRGAPRPGTISIVVRTLTGKHLDVHNLEPKTFVYELKAFIQDAEGIPPDQQRLVCKGKQLEDGRTIGSHGICNGDRMSLVLRLRGGGDGPPPGESEFGIAAGGLIKQCVVEDEYPGSIWDIDRALFFNVQILNSHHFELVTGRAPPATPISAQTYASNGLPFFEIYNETSKVKGDFKDVKSVVAMDQSKAGKETSHDNMADEKPVTTPVVLLNQDGTNCGCRFKPVNVMKAELKAVTHAQF